MIPSWSRTEEAFSDNRTRPAVVRNFCSKKIIRDGSLCDFLLFSTKKEQSCSTLLHYCAIRVTNIFQYGATNGLIISDQSLPLLCFCGKLDSCMDCLQHIGGGINRRQCHRLLSSISSISSS